MAEEELHNEHKSVNFEPVTWIAGALLIMGLAALAGFYWKHTVVIGEVQFAGNHFVTQEELEQVDIPTGISPDSVNFMNIIGQVERIPYVKKASINVEPSGNLTIQVSERRPIALLASGDDKIYVDGDGILLPLELEKAVDVPIVYGFRTEPIGDTLKTTSWQQTCSFLLDIESSAFANATISEVAWTQDEGVVALSYENGVKLVFGKGDFKTRLRNWKAFYSKVIRKKGIQSMRTIDLRFKGQIVTRES